LIYIDVHCFALSSLTVHGGSYWTYLQLLLILPGLLCLMKHILAFSKVHACHTDINAWCNTQISVHESVVDDARHAVGNCWGSCCSSV